MYYTANNPPKSVAEGILFITSDEMQRTQIANLLCVNYEDDGYRQVWLFRDNSVLTREHTANPGFQWHVTN